MYGVFEEQTVVLKGKGLIELPFSGCYGEAFCLPGDGRVLVLQ